MQKKSCNERERGELTENHQAERSTLSQHQRIKELEATEQNLRQEKANLIIQHQTNLQKEQLEKKFIIKDGRRFQSPLSDFVEGPDHTANVPTVKNPDDVIIEVGPTNKIVYISGVLNETPL
ncbi:1053_t:CDS:2 [Entrophospora sp. SA101]|nr:1053_t:CDS:2 [Entrophospora sp. SA101]